jgi:hypothetical protein
LAGIILLLVWRERVESLEVGDSQRMGESDVCVEAYGVEDLAFDVEDSVAVGYIPLLGEVIGLGVWGRCRFGG